MDKKIGSRKLVLQRETIRELTPDELTAVDGGVSWSVSKDGWSVSVSASQSVSASVGPRSFGISQGYASIGASGG
jgi:hypothetical protein